ncbi:MAG TPA: hypothetical protein VFW90_03345 [Candidatus Saccharimonadales bacterium]|nr:hypothetical protein [Candidatus Saccharimonadales bacterium]
MVDALYARYVRRNKRALDPGYKAHYAIKGHKLLNRRAGKLAVIFPGWHTHKFPTDILARRLVKRGWAVLLYDFHDQILEPDDETVADSFHFIRDTITSDIKRLTTKRAYRQIHFISISLGTVPMTLVADSFGHFTSATFVAAGDDLAVDMWHGLRTLDLRDEFLKEHIGMRKLDKDWKEEIPVKHLRHFAGKPVRVILSKNDKFILPKYQYKFVEDLKRLNDLVDLRTRRLGHLLTIVRYCLFDRPV